MSHSVVDYRGEGFFANDVALAVWMALAVEEIDKVQSPEPWVVEWRKRLRRDADLAEGGILDPEFNEYLTGEQRLEIARKISANVLACLQQFGDTIPKQFLDLLKIGSSKEEWTGNPPSKIFLETAVQINDLLNGEKIT